MRRSTKASGRYFAALNRSSEIVLLLTSSRKALSRSIILREEYKFISSSVSVIVLFRDELV